MTLPNFVIIGAGRAGTTSIYHYLQQHPDVFMSPIKETNFLVYRAMQADGSRTRSESPTTFPVRSLERYKSLFERAGHARAIGEASPRYMADALVAEGLAELLPRARLVAILRDPIDRAYSSYLFHRRDGREGRSFEQAVAEEQQGTCAEGLRFGQRHYVGLGFYDRHLAPYFERFPRRQIGVFLYDDLVQNPTAFMEELFRFLNVDPSFQPEMSVRYNVGGVLRGAWSRTAFKKRPWLIRFKRALPAPVRRVGDRWIEGLRASRLDVPSLSEEVRLQLADVYAEDVAHLEERIGRRLKGWLTPHRRG